MNRQPDLGFTLIDRTDRHPQYRGYYGGYSRAELCDVYSTMTSYHYIYSPLGAIK